MSKYQQREGGRGGGIQSSSSSKKSSKQRRFCSRISCYILGGFMFMCYIFINYLRLLNRTTRTIFVPGYNNNVVVIDDDSPHHRSATSRITTASQIVSGNTSSALLPTTESTTTATETTNTTEFSTITNNTSSSIVINNNNYSHVMTNCPSQYHVSSSNDEQSPILFRHNPNNDNSNRQNPNDLLVCRCPKVGSTMLRNILNLYYYHHNYHHRNNSKKDMVVAAPDYDKKPKSPKEEWLLGNSKMTPNEFQYWINSFDVSRIMFVRHPVMRIVAGYFEICYGNPHFRKYLKERKALNSEVKMIHQRQIQQLYHYGSNSNSSSSSSSNSNITQHQQQEETLLPDKEEYIKLFKRFIRHPNLLQKDYRSECLVDEKQQLHASEMSRSTLEQHWSPAQHCRCGINDCFVEYKIYHIERIQSIQSILKNYLFNHSDDNNSSSSSNVNNNDVDADVVPAWFPSELIVANTKKKRSNSTTLNFSSNKSSFYNQFIEDVLSDTVILSKLNNLTKKEQEYFGYLPFTLQHIHNGTIGLKSDVV